MEEAQGEGHVVWPQAKAPPEARGGKDYHLALSQGGWPCWHLDVRRLASRMVREYISVVLNHPVGGALLQWP